MADDPKDIIYVDIDDEITAVIDKLQSSPKKIVALVLPKRATVFQSVVNMKLLKRTAEEAKKHVVLVTSEAALLPMAGAVGLHVAKTPQSKPEIPAAPMAAMAAANVPEGDADADLDKSASVGALSGVPDEDDEAIQVDNSEPEASAADAGKKGKKGKGAGKKKFKIPNFDKFRTKLFLGIAVLVILIIGFVVAFMVLPKATVTLKTDTSNIDTNMTIIADPAAERLDQEKNVIQAISKEFRKTDTEKVAATGEKDLGKKATGEVTFTTECSGKAPTIPSGTGVSTNNLTFITQETVTLESGDDAEGNCVRSGIAGVVAKDAGEQFNVGSGRTFTVAGYSSLSATNESAMSGGTSKIVKIVTQGDVNKAKDAISKRAGTEAPDDLKDDISDEGYRPIEETLNAGTPTVSSSPAVGAEASEVTVTSTTVFTMLGVKEDDLKKLVEEDAKKKIDPSKQIILDNGLAEAIIRVEEKGAGGQMTLSLQTTVAAGPDLDEDELKKEFAGKKRGDIQNLMKGRPGVNDAEVSYSPFWVQSTPKSADKITIVIEGNQNNDDVQQP